MKTQKKHPLQVRVRAFSIFQKLGYFPWKKPAAEKKRKRGGDFYRGAFDNIPFLNKDARRTFSHLLLRPGYMIRDYIRGDHENYLAPLTSLIVFFAFFALVASVIRPETSDAAGSDIHVDMDIDTPLTQGTIDISEEVAKIVKTGLTYLNLDKHPEAVRTRQEAALAALEGSLRSQGIPLFLGKFLLLWLSMGLALRRLKMRMSAIAAASAYILCQASFLMIFALLLSLGKESFYSTATTILMTLLLVMDYRQWLGLSWRKSIGRTIATAVWYSLLFLLVILFVSFLVILIALLK